MPIPTPSGLRSIGWYKRHALWPFISHCPHYTERPKKEEEKNDKIEKKILNIKKCSKMENIFEIEKSPKMKGKMTLEKRNIDKKILITKTTQKIAK